MLLKWTPSALMEDFLNDEFRFMGRDMTSSRPAVNVSESEGNFKIEFAAPGLNKEDFELNIENNVLTISGEKEVGQEEKNDQYSRREFNYSSFKRSFTLPDNVDSEHIDARYENGLLCVDIPKLEKEEVRHSKRIEIH